MRLNLSRWIAELKIRHFSHSCYIYVILRATMSLFQNVCFHLISPWTSEKLCIKSHTIFWLMYHECISLPLFHQHLTIMLYGYIDLLSYSNAVMVSPLVTPKLMHMQTLYTGLWIFFCLLVLLFSHQNLQSTRMTNTVQGMTPKIWYEVPGIKGTNNNNYKILMMIGNVI